MSITTVAQYTQGWPTIEGYAWSEVVPTSPEEELRNDGSRAVRTFLVPWADRIAWAIRWLGYPEIKFDNGHWFISRRVPQEHPEYLDADNRPYLWATQVMRCEPWGLPDPTGSTFDMRTPLDVADYGFARIQVLYESVSYELLPDNEVLGEDDVPDEALLARYVTVTATPAGEMLNLPLAALAFVDGASPVNIVPGFTSRIEQKTDVVITWHLVPTEAVGMRVINPNADFWPIDDTLGRVNSDTFAGCRKGTLRLDAAIPRRHRSAIGDILWDVEFRFTHLDRGDDSQVPPVPIGHNHLLQFSGGTLTWREVVANDATPVVSNADAADQVDGKSLFDWRDFKRLFRVPLT